MVRNEFTAIIERDGEWHIAYCPEVPGANGQGRTKKECLESLRDSIEIIFKDRREDALRNMRVDAIQETVYVGTRKSASLTNEDVTRETPVSKRVELLYNKFGEYLEIHDRTSGFGGRQLELHLQTLALRNQNGAKESLDSENFISSLWETLVAWGMNRGGNLANKAQLRQSLTARGDVISQLECFKINELNPQQVETLSDDIWQLIKFLRVSSSSSQIVAGTKALHHILPELVPPVDRKWTGSFFRKYPPSFQGTGQPAEALFKYMFRTYAVIATQVSLQQFVGQGWHSSITKVIDNAVIGFGQAHPAIALGNN